jgi:hypothetical protein
MCLAKGCVFGDICLKKELQVIDEKKDVHILQPINQTTNEPKNPLKFPHYNK